MTGDNAVNQDRVDDLILSFDPFEGDFGMPGDMIFSDRLVIARKPGPCANCKQEIVSGERVRRMASKFDNEVMTHRWCSLCCEAMANYQAQSEDETREDMPDYDLRTQIC